MIYLALGWNLALTALIEGGAVALLFRRGRYVYYSLLCNLLTNPALNLLLLLAVKRFGADAYAPALVLLECIAVLVEAQVYRMLCGFSYKKAAAVSLLLNGLSLGLGFVIRTPFQ